jgi:hypothetical protein
MQCLEHKNLTKSSFEPIAFALLFLSLTACASSSNASAQPYPVNNDPPGQRPLWQQQGGAYGATCPPPMQPSPIGCVQPPAWPTWGANGGAAPPDQALACPPGFAPTGGQCVAQPAVTDPINAAATWLWSTFVTPPPAAPPPTQGGNP